MGADGVRFYKVSDFEKVLGILHKYGDNCGKEGADKLLEILQMVIWGTFIRYKQHRTPQRVCFLSEFTKITCTFVIPVPKGYTPNEQ